MFNGATEVLNFSTSEPEGRDCRHLSRQCLQTDGQLRRQRRLDSGTRVQTWISGAIRKPVRGRA